MVQKQQFKKGVVTKIQAVWHVPFWRLIVASFFCQLLVMATIKIKWVSKNNENNLKNPPNILEERHWKILRNVLLFAYVY